MILRHYMGRPLTALCVSLALSGAVASTLGIVASPAYAEEGGNTVRPEVGKPLQEAQAAIKAKNFSTALTKLKEADAISGRTPYEDGLISQLRLLAALGAGELGIATKAFDALSSGNVLAAPQKLQFTLAIASGYFQAKDYGNAATWSSRYIQAGGQEASVHLLLVQSYYLEGNYAQAAKSALDEVQSLERQGQTPGETYLQILQSAGQKQQDMKLYETALLRLATYYPKPDYWGELIHRLPGHPGFSEKLSLDVSRLALAAGIITTPAQYMEYAELAVQAGLPGEAESVVEKGYGAGVLGAGADAARHGRLKDLVKKAVDTDKKSLESGATEAAKAASGDPLVATGLNFYGYGQFDRAIALIEQGIAKGGLKSADEAKLHLGIAYLAAGKKAKAIETFKAVKGTDGTGDLANLWTLRAGGRPF